MLKGKVAIVTGGTRGIGLATVEKFLENHAAVALAGSRQETADKAVAQLRERYPDAQIMGIAPGPVGYRRCGSRFPTGKRSFWPPGYFGQQRGNLSAGFPLQLRSRRF